MFHLLWSLICGAVIGGIASMIMGQPSTTLRNIVIGIAGSYLGRFLFRCIGFYATTGLADIFVCIVGGCVLLMLVNWLAAKRR